MSNTLDNLYRLQKKDTHRAAVMLADAFQHDPVWNAVFGDATLAQRAYAFETPVRYSLKYGEVYAPSEALEGVAAWAPGALAELTSWRILRSGALWPAMKTGVQLAKKMQPIFRPIDLDRKAYMGGKPYIYLQIIGVAPAFQGQGFGGQLLRALIEKASRPAFRSTWKPKPKPTSACTNISGLPSSRRLCFPSLTFPCGK